MSNFDEKILFSKRLKKALELCQHPISPTYLAKQFNYRYSGAPISVQAANSWLTGKSIPNQDKLAILAIWLNKTPQWLRFGEDELTNELPSLQYSEQELAYFLKFKKLRSHQQKIIEDIIDEFLNLN